VSLKDAYEYGTTPRGLETQPHYWCSFCAEDWLAINMIDTGAGCRTCKAFMPLAAKYCGACGSVIEAV
jgi:hypothetical protein